MTPIMMGKLRAEPGPAEEEANGHEEHKEQLVRIVRLRVWLMEWSTGFKCSRPVFRLVAVLADG